MLTISMWGGRGVCVGKRFFKLETKKKCINLALYLKLYTFASKISSVTSKVTVL